MSYIIIDAESDTTNLLVSLAKKIGAKAKRINSSTLEDIVFGEIIQNSKTGVNVSKEEVLKKLNSISKLK